MNKYIISLVAAIVFTVTSVSVFGMTHVPTTMEQKIAVNEYFASNKEKHTAKAKQLFDLVLKIVPEFYLAELLLGPRDSIIQMIRLICSTEIMIYASVANHPELRAILEKHYDEATCKYAFDAGFNTVYSWEQFKVMYMYIIASYSKDAAFEKAFPKALKAEVIPFANYLISLK